MIASLNCTACDSGMYQSAEASTMCIRCASGKFSAAPAASDPSLCISKESSEAFVSFPLVLEQVQISMVFSLTEAAFTVLQNAYVMTAAKASRLDVRLFKIISVQEQMQRTLESPVLRAVMGINISKYNCTAISILTGPDHLNLMQDAGLPKPFQVSSNTNCASSTQRETLSQKLRDHAVVISTASVAVLAASVASNVAIQIVSGMTLTRTVSSKGASIYHLIGAVQFLNIFGKMFDRVEPSYFQQTSYHSSKQRRLGDMSALESLNNLSALGAQLNTTLSVASEFRSAYCTCIP
jgi:hypothetical protein